MTRVEFTEERKSSADAAVNSGLTTSESALIAIGFACLEVVLDRGERDDWLESHFIVSFSRDRGRRDRGSRSGGNGAMTIRWSN